MPVVRRPRRRPLFAAGLLPIMVLLLLLLSASWVLPRRWWRWPNVLDLNMPPRHPAALWNFWPPRHLDHLRTWQTFTLTGHTAHDTLMLRLFRRELARFAEQPDYRTGVRLQFGEQARYAGLVKGLDLMNQYDIRQYLLLLEQPVSTLYVLKMPRRTESVFPK